MRSVHRPPQQSEMRRDPCLPQTHTEGRRLLSQYRMRYLLERKISTMHVIRRGSSTSTLGIGLVLLTLLLLGGCGVTTGLPGTASSSQGTTGAAVASTPSATPTPTGASHGQGTPTVAGIGSTGTGCPSPTQVVDWPSPPTVTVTAKQASVGASLQVGQTLEIALAFGNRWSFAPAATQGVLLLNTPAGYGDPTLKSCIWRFTGEKAGEVTLTFTSAPICLAHMECPQYIGLLRIPVDVHQ